MADDAQESVVPTDQEKKTKKLNLSTPVWVCICIVALVLGVLGGHFLLKGTGSISLDGKTSLTSDELDKSIATYTYDGKTKDITAREVITQNSTLDAAADSDGNYKVPAPSEVTGYAQNAIILDAADAKGITVDDDDLSDYAKQMVGTDDYDQIAQNYKIDTDTAKNMLKSSAIMSKLRDSVVTTDLPDKVDAPTAPESGAEDTPTADYASYIINLLGDEWDADNNTWATEDGDYYAALSSYDISNDSATYAAAQAAYNVASSAYNDAYTQRSNEWTTYANGLLSKATMQMGSLV